MQVARCQDGCLVWGRGSLRSVARSGFWTLVAWPIRPVVPPVVTCVLVPVLCRLVGKLRGMLGRSSGSPAVRVLGTVGGRVSSVLLPPFWDPVCWWTGRRV